MSRFKFGACLSAVLAFSAPAHLFAAPSAPSPADKKPESETEKTDGGKFQPFKPESVSSTGTVTVGGQSISYQAVAGTLVIHPKDWDDVPRDPKTERGPSQADEGAEAKNPTAEASMFYVAYFKTGGAARPVTFIYNCGQGSSPGGRA